MQTMSGPPRRRKRLARALGLDGNPLRRASDRAEAWIRAGLIAVFMIAGPLAALGVGGWAYHAGATVARVQAAPAYHVKAAVPATTVTPADLPKFGEGNWVGGPLRRYRRLRSFRSVAGRGDDAGLHGTCVAGRPAADARVPDQTASGRVGEGMVEGRATVDREHFMTSHPIRRGSRNELTHPVMAVLGAGLAADLLLALDIPRGDSSRP